MKESMTLTTPVDIKSGTEPPSVEAVSSLARRRETLTEELGRVIVGQRAVIENVLLTVFCGGHALIVGVPGLAKTLLVRSLGEALDLKFSRIQFTPDLMPSDITGAEIIAEDPTTGKRRLEFLQGPVFANVILADEINRTPPKTQASMLQTMQEQELTAGSKTYALPKPFHVFATQNPLEMEGTYVLPEAQSDRFMFSIHCGYPTLAEEEAVLRNTTGVGTASIATPRMMKARGHRSFIVAIGSSSLRQAPFGSRTPPKLRAAEAGMWPCRASPHGSGCAKGSRGATCLRSTSTSIIVVRRHGSKAGA